MQDKQLIEKYSVIIAEFMGVKIVKRNGENAVYMYENAAFPEYFRCTKYNTYHTDWNEIHCVWEKFRNIDITTIHPMQLIYSLSKNEIEKAICNNDIFKAFTKIAETIEYLNTIK